MQMKISWTKTLTWTLPLVLTACNYPGASQGTVQPHPQAAKAPAPSANQSKPKPATPSPSSSPTALKPAANAAQSPALNTSAVAAAKPQASTPPAASASQSNSAVLKQSLSLLNAKNLAEEEDGSKTFSKGDETLMIVFDEDVTIPEVHQATDGDSSDKTTSAELQSGQWYAAAPKPNAFSCSVTYSFDSDDQSLVIRKGTSYTFERTGGSTSNKISHITLTAKQNDNSDASSISTIECDGNGGSFLLSDLVDAFNQQITVSTSSNGLLSKVESFVKKI
jgi:hypothetical protein